MNDERIEALASANSQALLSALAEVGWIQPTSAVPVLPWVVPTLPLGLWLPNYADIATHDISAAGNITIVDVVPANQWWEVWCLATNSLTGSSRWWILPATLAPGPYVMDNHTASSGGAVPVDLDATGVHLVQPGTPWRVGPGDAFGLSNTNNGGDNAMISRIAYRRTG